MPDLSELSLPSTERPGISGRRRGSSRAEKAERFGLSRRPRQQWFAFGGTTEAAPAAERKPAADLPPSRRVGSDRAGSERRVAEARPSRAEARVSITKAPPSTGESCPSADESPSAEQDTPAKASVAEQLARLRHRTAGLSSGSEHLETFSTGCPELDQWLPGGGLRRNGLCEWVGEQRGGAAGSMALIAAAAALGVLRNQAGREDLETGASDRPAGPLVVVDPEGVFHAAAAVAWGVPARRIVWCRPRGCRDTVWTLDQALRCPAVAGVWCRLPWRLGDRDARRLQLAAEAGRTPGLLVREASARRQPSFAAVRWHVTVGEPPPPVQEAGSRPGFGQRRWAQLTLDRVRGAGLAAPAQATALPGRQAWVAIRDDARMELVEVPTSALERSSSPAASSSPAVSHATTNVHLASQLARPASTRRRPRRAG